MFTKGRSEFPSNVAPVKGCMRDRCKCADDVRGDHLQKYTVTPTGTTHRTAKISRCHSLQYSAKAALSGITWLNRDAVFGMEAVLWEWESKGLNQSQGGMYICVIWGMGR